MKALVARATGTVFKGILPGAAVTLLIQSSSATTVIVIGLISAGLMTFRQSIGITMGSEYRNDRHRFLDWSERCGIFILIMALGAAMSVLPKQEDQRVGKSHLRICGCVCRS